MILTDQEMRQIQKALETQAELDEELLQRCSHLIHLGAFDEAVRSAFILLEERLREAVDGEGMTGTQLANHAFGPASGLLAKHPTRNQSERDGLRELYSGAFKLFRNPTAHGVVNYSASEGKAIIGLVDLMLKMLKQIEKSPLSGLLPDNVENRVDEIEKSIGPGAASRLRSFLGRCVEIGLRPSTAPKTFIPFRKHGLVRFDHMDEPSQRLVPVFYVGREYDLEFPVNNYHVYVVGFDADQLSDELKNRGFQPARTHRNPTADLRIHNSQEFFDDLFDLIVNVTDELEETLQQDQ